MNKPMKKATKLSNDSSLNYIAVQVAMSLDLPKSISYSVGRDLKAALHVDQLKNCPSFNTKRLITDFNSGKISISHELVQQSKTIQSLSKFSEPKVKRKVGRPKGSTNKKKIESSYADFNLDNPNDMTKDQLLQLLKAALVS